MKKILLSFLVILFSFSFSSVYSNNIFDNDRATIPYCENDEDCGLVEWINQIKNSDLDWVVKEGKASIYIQKIVVYLLWFLSIVWVLIIIYSWFRLLVSWWNEEQMTNSKKIITYVVIWFVIIFVAGPLIVFIVDVLTQSDSVTQGN